MKKLTTTIVMVCCIFWLSASHAEDQTCVPHELAMQAWGEAVDKMDRPAIGIVTTYAVCNPCSCPLNGMASCYEYMAKEERMKAEKHNYMRDLLSRATKYGICR